MKYEALEIKRLEKTLKKKEFVFHPMIIPLRAGLDDLEFLVRDLS